MAKLQKRNVKKINRRNATERSKNVYILISKTSTLPSDIIKMWTKEQYAHTSLALDIELNEMYSFARKRLRNPFYCGFISEDITKGVFGRDVNTTCMVMRLRVTPNEHKNIIKILDRFKKNSAIYKYNYLGIVGVMINKSVERPYNYFCSQFVYFVLDKAGVPLFNKPSGLVRPEDFRTWEGLEVVYEGRLHDYRDFLREKYVVEKKETVIDKLR